ncbi:phosphatase PAP2 family protein [Pedobacter sp. HMF7647]|uniref:Phosphatase PAP2 family protein n=1 Tax=Hufsiella arboris TaxID=2695275 RepID=A0A7K1YD57_9SPHI|nr:phosphatase PAP2 family protein [Hufsiella arboris]MXV52505.1 phosphatase PAP2 family protein [Hufsiella arboris]
MIEHIMQFDQQLFFAINRGLSNPFFDWLMPFLRNRYFWTPLYLFLVVFFIRNYEKKGIMLIVFLLITFALADMSSASMIKPLIHRLRPCNDPSINQMVRAIAGCGTGFSFPSSHAANHFAIAVFLVTVFRHKWKWITPLALFWAASICFAQVYVGVHYPVDVTVGGLLGALIGYITGTIFLAIQRDKQWSTGN